MSNENAANVKQAEREVERSTAQFETAMGHLERKVESTSAQVHRTLELARKPKQVVSDAISRSRTRVRQNPAPYVVTAAAAACGVIAGLISARLERRRSLEELERIDSVSVLA